MNSNKNNDPIKQYRFELDDQPFQTAIRQLEASTTKFGSVFATTMRSAVKSSKSFEDILKSLGSRMADLALSQAFKPIEGMMGGMMNQFMGGLAIGLSGGGMLGGAGGGSGMPLNITPFAKGGVVGSPNYFSFGSRVGVMGERGNEAIMPLSRGSDGRLGVAAAAAPNGTNITFNVSANDPSTFAKSEGQISAMLARAVARGQRRL